MDSKSWYLGGNFQIGIIDLNHVICIATIILGSEFTKREPPICQEQHFPFQFQLALPAFLFNAVQFRPTEDSGATADCRLG